MRERSVHRRAAVQSLLQHLGELGKRAVCGEASGATDALGWLVECQVQGPAVLVMLDPKFKGDECTRSALRWVRWVCALGPAPAGYEGRGIVPQWSAVKAAQVQVYVWLVQSWTVEREFRQRYPAVYQGKYGKVGGQPCRPTAENLDWQLWSPEWAPSQENREAALASGGKVA